MEIFSGHYGINNYKRGSKTWYFPTQKGTAELRLRAIETYEDALKHQGHQFTWIGFDELTQWQNDLPFEYLFNNRLRAPKKSGGKKVSTYLRATANPGGVGHSWVKERYRIGGQKPFVPWVFATNKNTGEEDERVFVPAKLTDNKILMDNDSSYETRLDNIPDEIMRRALRDGDWDIAQGAAFPEFNSTIHVVDDHEVPKGVPMIRSMDWGRAKPYACIWLYVNYDGDLNVCHELYGCSVDKHDTGLGTDPDLVAARIKDIEERHGWNIKEAWLDPQCWAKHGGPSIFDQLGGYRMRWKPWPTGQFSRENAKSIVHEYLRVVNGA